MLPYEVVVRREAHGSYLKRNPHFSKGQLFPQLIVELFLKTKDKNWKGMPVETLAPERILGALEESIARRNREGRMWPAFLDLFWIGRRVDDPPPSAHQR